MQGGKGLTLASKPGAPNDIFKTLAKEVEKAHNKINPEHPMDIQRNVLARHLQEVTDTIFQAQNTGEEPFSLVWSITCTVVFYLSVMCGSLLEGSGGRVGRGGRERRHVVCGRGGVLCLVSGTWALCFVWLI